MRFWMHKDYLNCVARCFLAMSQSSAHLGPHSTVSQRERVIGTRTCRLRALLLLLLTLSLTANAHPQVTGQTNDFLPPPKTSLVPLHWPDLTALEPEVREQLKSLQTTLAASAKRSNITDAALSEA